MSTLTITESVALSPDCGCKGGRLVAFNTPGFAFCNLCGRTVSLKEDVEPHLDKGERLVWINRLIRLSNGFTYDGIVLAYFTENEEG